MVCGSSLLTQSRNAAAVKSSEFRINSPFAILPVRAFASAMTTDQITPTRPHAESRVVWRKYWVI
jgi:hypothetical protein